MGRKPLKQIGNLPERDNTVTKRRRRKGNKQKGGSKKTKSIEDFVERDEDAFLTIALAKTPKISNAGKRPSKQAIEHMNRLSANGVSPTEKPKKKKSGKSDAKPTSKQVKFQTANEPPTRLFEPGGMMNNSPIVRPHPTTVVGYAGLSHIRSIFSSDRSPFSRPATTSSRPPFAPASDRKREGGDKYIVPVDESMDCDSDKESMELSPVEVRQESDNSRGFLVPASERKLAARPAVEAKEAASPIGRRSMTPKKKTKPGGPSSGTLFRSKRPSLGASQRCLPNKGKSRAFRERKCSSNNSIGTPATLVEESLHQPHSTKVASRKSEAPSTKKALSSKQCDNPELMSLLLNSTKVPKRNTQLHGEIVGRSFGGEECASLDGSEITMNTFQSLEAFDGRQRSSQYRSGSPNITVAPGKSPVAFVAVSNKKNEHAQARKAKKKIALCQEHLKANSVLKPRIATSITFPPAGEEANSSPMKPRKLDSSKVLQDRPTLSMPDDTNIFRPSECDIMLIDHSAVTKRPTTIQRTPKHKSTDSALAQQLQGNVTSAVDTCQLQDSLEMKSTAPRSKEELEKKRLTPLPDPEERSLLSESASIARQYLQQVLTQRTPAPKSMAEQTNKTSGTTSDDSTITDRSEEIGADNYLASKSAQPCNLQRPQQESKAQAVESDVEEVQDDKEDSQSICTIFLLKRDEAPDVQETIYFRCDGELIPHPPLPSGWNIKISKSKNRPFYYHPDLGTTWHCPVIIPFAHSGQIVRKEQPADIPDDHRVQNPEMMEHLRVPDPVRVHNYAISSSNTKERNSEHEAATAEVVDGTDAEQLSEDNSASQNTGSNQSSTLVSNLFSRMHLPSRKIPKTVSQSPENQSSEEEVYSPEGSGSPEDRHSSDCVVGFGVSAHDAEVFRPFTATHDKKANSNRIVSTMSDTSSLSLLSSYSRKSLSDFRMRTQPTEDSTGEVVTLQHRPSRRRGTVMLYDTDRLEAVENLSTNHDRRMPPCDQKQDAKMRAPSLSALIEECRHEEELTAEAQGDEPSTHIQNTSGTKKKIPDEAESPLRYIIPPSDTGDTGVVTHDEASHRSAKSGFTSSQFSSSSFGDDKTSVEESRTTNTQSHGDDHSEFPISDGESSELEAVPSVGGTQCSPSVPDSQDDGFLLPEGDASEELICQSSLRDGSPTDGFEENVEIEESSFEESEIAPPEEVIVRQSAKKAMPVKRSQALLSPMISDISASADEGASPPERKRHRYLSSALEKVEEVTDEFSTSESNEGFIEEKTEESPEEFSIAEDHDEDMDDFPDDGSTGNQSNQDYGSVSTGISSPPQVARKLKNAKTGLSLRILHPPHPLCKLQFLDMLLEETRKKAIQQTKRTKVAERGPKVPVRGKKKNGKVAKRLTY